MKPARDVIYNPNPVNDWEAWQEQEVALDKAMEYALDGRL